MWRKRLIRSSSTFFVAFAALSSATVIAAEYFPRDLSLGDSGRDVTNLQVVLNSSARTQVAPAGAGSPGKESDFFGALSLDAVVRYQMAKGISPLNGEVSGKTRQFLQSDLEKIVGAGAGGGSAAAAPRVSTTGQISDQVRTAAEKIETDRISAVSGAPIIFGGLGISAEAGSRVNIFGYNFIPGETYQLVVASTSKKFADAVATSSIAATLKMPRIKVGEYSVYAEGSNGRSANFPISVAGSGRPTIKRITPATIKLGDLVTIEGARFGRKGVTVTSSLGAVGELTVKGQKITFTSEIGSTLPKIRAASGATTTVPVTIRVKNSRGASDPAIVYVAL